MGKLSCCLLICYYLYVVLLYITMWFTINSVVKRFFKKINSEITLKYFRLVPLLNMEFLTAGAGAEITGVCTALMSERRKECWNGNTYSSIFKNLHAVVVDIMTPLHPCISLVLLELRRQHSPVSKKIYTFQK